MNPDFDVVILGGGPGGYLAAERLGQAGRKVALVEEKALGGTCLNVGCIPTKTLLNSAKHYLSAIEGEQFGISCAKVDFDWARMQNWKDQVVEGLVCGVSSTLSRAGVQVITGHGILEGPSRVRVGNELIRAEHVILATGSHAVWPNIPGATNNPLVVDSTGLLCVPEVPKRLSIIGGGVIGVEFAALFSALGSTVQVIEALDEIVPFADEDLAARLRETMPQVTFNLGSRVERIEGGTVICSQAGQPRTIESDLILMAVGRKPAVSGWGAIEAGLDHSSGGVVVDDRLRTNLPNVWAIGDLTGRSLLAHSAYRMGEVAAAGILDPQAHLKGEIMRWHTIPWCVYAFTELAGVGYTRRQAEALGHRVQVGRVPAQLSGRFVAEHGFKAPGSAKVIIDKTTHKVLGIQVLSPYASELIWGAGALLETEFDLRELRQIVFPHPTVSELIREAAWAIRP